MKITYQNTYFDRIRFHTLHQLYCPLVQAVAILGALMNFWLVFNDDSLMAAVEWGLIIYVCIWAGQILFTALHLVTTNHPSAYAEHTLEILETGLQEQTPYHQSIHYWHGIVKIVKRAGFLAIYVNPQCAHLVPTRAFSSATEAQAFAEQIYTRLAAHPYSQAH